MVLHCCIKQLLLQRLDFLFRQLQEEASRSLEALEKCNAFATRTGESTTHDSEHAQRLYAEAQAAVRRHREIGHRRKHLCNAMSQLWLDENSSRFNVTFSSMTSSIPTGGNKMPLLNLSSLSVWLDEQSSNLGIDFAFGQDKMKDIYRDVTGQTLVKSISKRDASDQFRMIPKLSEEKCNEVSAATKLNGGVTKEMLLWCVRYEPIFRIASDDNAFDESDLRGGVENEDTLRVVLLACLDKKTFNAVIKEFSRNGDGEGNSLENSNMSAGSQVFDESNIRQLLSTAKSDWRSRVQCLQKLAAYLSATRIDESEFHRVMSEMKDGICLQIQDLRSSLSKTASESCAGICEARPRSFLPFIVDVLDALFTQVHIATKPTSEAAKAAVVRVVMAVVFDHELAEEDGTDCRSPRQNLMAYMRNVIEASKHEKQRAHVCTTLGHIFGKMKGQGDNNGLEDDHKDNQENVPPTNTADEDCEEDVVMEDATEPRDKKLETSCLASEWVKNAVDVLKVSFDDPKPIVREEAMKCLVSLHKLSECMAKNLYQSLRPNQQRKFDEIVHGKSRRSGSRPRSRDLRKWKKAQLTKTASAQAVVIA